MEAPHYRLPNANLWAKFSRQLRACEAKPLCQNTTKKKTQAGWHQWTQVCFKTHWLPRTKRLGSRKRKSHYSPRGSETSLLKSHMCFTVHLPWIYIHSPVFRFTYHTDALLFYNWSILFLFIYFFLNALLLEKSFPNTRKMCFQRNLCSIIHYC